MAKMIEILCPVDSFRRGGIAHQQGKKVYPLNTFTAEQIKQLKAEKKLSVREFEEKRKGKNNVCDCNRSTAILNYLVLIL